jgi:NAD(P)-dependent dehydrogenase (short-subunit alcohol dehydrogenase family)
MSAVQRFAGKVAIVTGGASGIGLVTAQRLALEGAFVVIADLKREAAEEAAGGLGAAGAEKALGLRCDVADEAQVEVAVRATLDRFGRLDIVVNNAGMMLFKPLEEFTSQDWNRVLGVNLMGAVHFTRQAFLHMQGGAIVNLSSIHAERTSPLVAPYAAAKAALLSLTRSAAIEGAAKRIRVNAIMPGAIDTPMLWDNPNVKSGQEAIDRKDVGRPEDVASAIAHLASDDATFITGAVLSVDGGRLGRL